VSMLGLLLNVDMYALHQAVRVSAEKSSSDYVWIARRMNR
jgi:hypothetical protein